jgi:putative sporulation protein YyaC
LKKSRLLSSLPQNQAGCCESPLRVNYKDPQAAEKISATLKQLMMREERNRRGLVRLVLCIGSDRSTGDALGPLVGESLAKLKLPRVMVWGTLADPVHALNLDSYLQQLKANENQPLTIAVDASLGKPGSIGTIEVGAGPLYPGAGVHKRLPPVGHVYLSGIVNLGGFMEQMVLQSTRLFHVMELSAVMAVSLQRALNER